MLFINCFFLINRWKKKLRWLESVSFCSVRLSWPWRMNWSGWVWFRFSFPLIGLAGMHKYWDALLTALWKDKKKREALLCKIKIQLRFPPYLLLSLHHLHLQECPPVVWRQDSWTRQRVPRTSCYRQSEGPRGLRLPSLERECVSVRFAPWQRWKVYPTYQEFFHGGSSLSGLGQD